jgi:hypothetical protein
MASFNILLNSKNVVSGTNNSQFQYSFPNGSFQVPEGSEMGISQITIPYSWYNVSAQYGNNSFSYTLTQGPAGSTTTVTKTVTLADGFYTAADINTALQNSLKANGFYWYSEGASSTYTLGNSNQQYIFPISFVSVPSQYTNGFTFIFIPPSDTAGTSVTGSSITNGVLTLGTAQNLLSGVQYYLSGTGVVKGSWITGTGSSTATYTVSIPQTVSSTAITVSRKLVYDQLGYAWAWAGGDGTNSGQVTGGSVCYSATITIAGTTTSSSYTLGNILGFTSATYPATAQSYTAPSTNSNSFPFTIYGNTLKSYSYAIAGVSNALTVAAANPPFAPIGSAVNGVVVRCNLISNRTAVPSDVMDSFPITSTFGSNINYLPISDNWVTLRAGSYQNLVITFVDQNYNQLICNDPTILITLLIRFPK